MLRGFTLGASYLFYIFTTYFDSQFQTSKMKRKHVDVDNNKFHIWVLV